MANKINEEELKAVNGGEKSTDALKKAQSLYAGEKLYRVLTQADVGKNFYIEFSDFSYVYGTFKALLTRTNNAKVLVIASTRDGAKVGNLITFENKDIWLYSAKQ